MGPFVALVHVSQKAAEGAVLRVIDRDRQVAVDPLVMQVVVHPNDVDVIRSTPKLRTQAT
jgi:hypothetical protein